MHFTLSTINDYLLENYKIVLNLRKIFAKDNKNLSSKSKEKLIKDFLELFHFSHKK